MTIAILFATTLFAEPPGLGGHIDPDDVVYNSVLEKIRVSELRYVRACLKLLIVAIEYYQERWEEEFSGQRLESAEKYRLEIVRCLKDEARFRVRERELWEQQPGGITAPAPREVKRKSQ